MKYAIAFVVLVLIVLGCSERDRPPQGTAQGSPHGVVQHHAEAVSVRLCKIGDGKKRMRTYILLFARVNGGKPIQCEIHPEHPLFQAIGYDKLPSYEIMKKDLANLPEFSIVVSKQVGTSTWDKGLQKLISWEIVKAIKDTEPAHEH